MPQIRPFRALRYVPDAVGDLAAVVAPPYDVVGPLEHSRLLARHPKNVVRLDLPSAELGDADDERYRRAARALAAWRSDGTLHKDPRPAVYVYEQVYRVPGTDIERGQRGFFARLRLEPFGEGSGVLPHERTLAGPREDRYRLLRATGVNTSPVVGLYEEPADRAAAAALDEIADRSPAIDVTDDEGTRHRLWVVEADGPDADAVRSLLAAACAGPITIADGHHRYETALRYRDERRMSRSCEEDPAFDYLMMLFLAADSEALTVLPTHRIVRGLGDDGLEGLAGRLPAFFEVAPADRGGLLKTFGSGIDEGGRGRFGLWTRDGGWLLRARLEALMSAQGGGGDAARRLDVVLLGTALERLWEIDAGAIASGDRIAYTKSAAEAIERVDAATDGADAAFLLEPTPVRSIVEVAAAGDVMPQKSTYFYPKALTGLVINPHEW